MMAGARPGPGRLAVWSVFLALSLRLLHGAAFGHLSVPLDSIDELSAWLDRTSPPVMALAVVRLAALVAAWYLAGATLLAVVADLAGWRRVAALVAAVSPDIVRRLASRSAGVGLAAGALLAAAPLPPRLLAAPAESGPAATAGQPASARAPAAATDPPPGDTGRSAPEPGLAPAATAAPLPAEGTEPPPTATMTRLDPAGDAEAASEQPAGAIPPPNDATEPPTTAAITRLDQIDDTAGPAPAPGPDGAAPTEPQPEGDASRSAAGDTGTGRTGPGAEAGRGGPDGTPSTPAEPDADAGRSRAADEPVGGEVWTVAAGDSFWSIAEETVADVAGHQPTEREVGRYWLRLIEANRHRLADPANPDLLIPGQQLELPPPG